MALSDIWITNACKGDRPLITPFQPQSCSVIEHGIKTKKVTSFGLSSYGYDLSLGNTFKLLKARTPDALFDTHIDPCDFDNSLFDDYTVAPGSIFAIPPRGFALGVSAERIWMPDDVTGICMQKSTIARAALEVTVTPLEAGWQGWLTLEFYNKTDFYLDLTPGMGIVQLVFFKGNEPCDVPYHARGGKYNNQPNVPVGPLSKPE